MPTNFTKSKKRKKSPVEEQVKEDEDEFEEFEGFGDYEEEVSEFERARLENIRRNQEVFEQLGVNAAKSEFSASKKRKVNSDGSLEVGGLKREKREREILPPRPKSRRLQNKKPEKAEESFRYAPGDTFVPSIDPWDIRKPQEMDMECVNEVEEEELRSAVEGWFNIKIVKASKVKEEDGGGNEEEEEEKIESSEKVKVQMAENLQVKLENLEGQEAKPDPDERSSRTRRTQKVVKKESKTTVVQMTDIERYHNYDNNFDVKMMAKVNRNRAFSLAWHPSSTKRLLFQGDKKGAVGVWDMDRGDGKESVFLFDVHAARPISHLAFNPSDTTKLYSCCYDGTVTCGDFTQMKFVQKFAFDATDKAAVSHFAWPCGERNSLLCSTTFSEVINLDVSTGKPAQTFDMGGKRMKSIDCHPVNSNLIAVSYSNGIVATYDWRTLSEQGNNAKKHISSIQVAAKPITKSYFSPQTGNKLLVTSQDDHIRIYNVDQSGIMKIRHTIRHKNYVGRWVTTFRPTWDPKTDNVFSSGSMREPRQVDLLACDEKDSGKLLQSSLVSENLTHISPINVFHPSLDLLASMNSSGRCLVWGHWGTEE